jgi:hypothetical protein
VKAQERHRGGTREAHGRRTHLLVELRHEEVADAEVIVSVLVGVHPEQVGVRLVPDLLSAEHRAVAWWLYVEVILADYVVVTLRLRAGARGG